MLPVSDGSELLKPVEAMPATSPDKGVAWCADCETRYQIAGHIDRDVENLGLVLASRSGQRIVISNDFSPSIICDTVLPPMAV